jgi:deoxyribose-phosphate aldolase
MMKSGRFDAVEIDVKNVIAMTPQKVHKVIIETGSLTPDEIARASRIAVRAGAEFIKTSTGYGPRGATVDDVRLIRREIGSSCRIKASGGIGPPKRRRSRRALSASERARTVDHEEYLKKSG